MVSRGSPTKRAGRAGAPKGGHVPVEEHASAANAEGWLADGGEMGELIRSLDWSKSAIGPLDSWPQSLRTAVSICLNSRFPILIWWGPELVKIYNDAYRQVLGSKHPRSMGARGRDVWPEIWDIIGPMLEGVLRDGVATWSDDQLLMLERNGYPEECYFTFSYSPIRDESGGIGGVFCAVTETTGRVLSERRLRALRELAACTNEARTVRAACDGIAAALGAAPADIPVALLYLLDRDGATASLACTAGVAPGSAASPCTIALATGSEPGGIARAEDVWPLARVAESGEVIAVSDLIERFGPLGNAPEPDAPHTAVVAPVPAAGQQQLAGMLILA